ncbi:vacuolar membrane-associated protein iml1 [Dimargaris cristalligena]|nr:vacuolar membrane-associated protein iml1 [Dimargaris cristalligena]
MDWLNAKKCSLRFHDSTTPDKDVIICSDYFPNIVVGDLLRIAPLLSTTAANAPTSTTSNNDDYGAKPANSPHFRSGNQGPPPAPSHPFGDNLTVNPIINQVQYAGHGASRPGTPNVGATPGLGKSAAGAYTSSPFAGGGRPGTGSRRNSAYGADIASPVDTSAEIILQVTEVDHARVSTANPISIAQTTANRLKLTVMMTVLVQKVDPAQATAHYIELQLRNPLVDRSDMLRFQSLVTGKVLYEGQVVDYLRCFQAKVKLIKNDRGGVRMAYVTPQTRMVFRTVSARFMIFIQFSREMWQFLEDGTLYYERGLQYFLTDLFRKWGENGTKHLVTLVLFSRFVYTEEEHLQIEGVSWHPDLRFWYKDYYKVVADNVQASLLCPNQDQAALLLRQDFVDFNADIMRSIRSVGETHDTSSSSYQSTSQGSSKTPDPLHQWAHPTPASQSQSGPGDYDSGPAPRSSRTGPRALMGRHTYALHGNILEAINLALNSFERRHDSRDTLRISPKIVVVTPSAGVFDVGKSLLRLTTQRLIDANLRVDVVCLAPKPLHRAPVFRFKSALPSPWRRAEIHGDSSENDFRTYQSLYFNTGLVGAKPTTEADDVIPTKYAPYGHITGANHHLLGMQESPLLGRSHSPGTTTDPTSIKKHIESTIDILYYDEHLGSTTVRTPQGTEESSHSAASPSYFTSHSHSQSQTHLASPGLTHATLEGRHRGSVAATTAGAPRGGAPEAVAQGSHLTHLDTDSDYWFYFVPFWVDSSFYQQNCLVHQALSKYRFKPYCRMPEIQKAGTGKHLRTVWQVPYLSEDISRSRERQAAVHIRSSGNTATVGLMRGPSLTRRGPGGIPGTDSPGPTEAGENTVDLSETNPHYANMDESQTRGLESGGTPPAPLLSSSFRSQPQLGGAVVLPPMRPSASSSHFHHTRSFSRTSSQTGRSTDVLAKQGVLLPTVQRHYDHDIFAPSYELAEIQRDSDRSYAPSPDKGLTSFQQPLMALRSAGDRVSEPRLAESDPERPKTGGGDLAGSGEGGTRMEEFPRRAHRYHHSPSSATPPISRASPSARGHLLDMGQRSASLRTGQEGGSLPHQSDVLSGGRHHRVYRIESLAPSPIHRLPGAPNPHDPWFHYYAPSYASSITPALQVPLCQYSHGQSTALWERSSQQRAQSLGPNHPLLLRSRSDRRASMPAKRAPAGRLPPAAQSSIDLGGLGPDGGDSAENVLEKWAGEPSELPHNTVPGLRGLTMPRSSGPEVQSPPTSGLSQSLRAPRFSPSGLGNVGGGPNHSWRSRYSTDLGPSPTGGVPPSRGGPTPMGRPGVVRTTPAAPPEPFALASPVLPSGAFQTTTLVGPYNNHPSAARQIYFVEAQKSTLFQRQFRRWETVYLGLPSRSTVQWKSLVTPAYLPLTTFHPPDPAQMALSYQEYPTNLTPDPDLLARSTRVTSTLPELAADPKHGAKLKALLCDLIAARFGEGFQIVVPSAATPAAVPLPGSLWPGDPHNPSPNPAHPPPPGGLRSLGGYDEMPSYLPAGKHSSQYPASSHTTYSSHPHHHHGHHGHHHHSSSISLSRRMSGRTGGAFRGASGYDSLLNGIPDSGPATSEPTWDQITGQAFNYTLSNGQDYHIIHYQPTNHEITTKRYVKTQNYRREEQVYRYQLWGRYASAYVPRSIIFKYADKTDYQWNTCDQLIVDYSDHLNKAAYSCVRLVLVPLEKLASPIQSSSANRNTRLSDEEQRIAGFRRFLDVLVRIRRSEPPLGSNLAGERTNPPGAPTDTHREAAAGKEGGGGDTRSAPSTLQITITTKRPSAFYQDMVAKQEKTVSGPTETPAPPKVRSRKRDHLPLTPQSSLYDIATEMQNPDSGLKIAIRRWHWRLYSNAFLGQEFVDWLLGQMSEFETRDQAAKFAQTLLNQKLFYHCRGRSVFLDDMMIYQLNVNYVSDKPSPLATASTGDASRGTASAVTSDGGPPTTGTTADLREVITNEHTISRAWFANIASLLLSTYDGGSPASASHSGKPNGEGSEGSDMAKTTSSPGSGPTGLRDSQGKRSYNHLATKLSVSNLSLVHQAGGATSATPIRSLSGDYFTSHKPVPISVKGNRTYNGVPVQEGTNSITSVIPKSRNGGGGGHPPHQPSVRSASSERSLGPITGPTIPISDRITVNIDDRRLSDRRELAMLEYDKVYVPIACFHLTLYWLNCTASLVEDQISSWTRVAERCGLRLVKVPARRLTDDDLSNHHPFLSTQDIRFAIPPTVEEVMDRMVLTSYSRAATVAGDPHQFTSITSTNTTTNTTATTTTTSPVGDLSWVDFLPKYFFEEAVLAHMNFVLDSEADRLFPEEVVRSIPPRNKFDYHQYIHRSGLAFVQIRSSGCLRWINNSLHLATEAAALTRINSFSNAALVGPGSTNSGGVGVGGVSGSGNSSSITSNGPGGSGAVGGGGSPGFSSTNNLTGNLMTSSSSLTTGTLGGLNSGPNSSHQTGELTDGHLTESGKGREGGCSLQSPYEQVNQLRQQLVDFCSDSDQLDQLWRSTIQQMNKEYGLSVISNMLPEKDLTGLDIEF